MINLVNIVIVYEDPFQSVQQVLNRSSATMSEANLTASSDESSLDDDFFEKNLTASRNDINKDVIAVFDEYSRRFKSLKERQNKLVSYLTIISEHCSKSGAPGKENSILKLNIGGEDVNIRRKAIRQYEQGHNILSLLLSNPWDYILMRNHKGRIFLNVNPAWITPIINLVREQSMTDSKDVSIPAVSVEHKQGFDSVASYYNFLPSRQENCVIWSGKSKIDCMNTRAAMRTLHSFLQPETIGNRPLDIGLSLIYRRSRDGYKKLSMQCKGQGSSVIVIEDTAGNVFGGYFHNKQDSHIFLNDTKSFLFNLNGFEISEKFASLGTLQFPWSPYGPSAINFGSDLKTNGQHEVNSTLGQNFSANKRSTLFGNRVANIASSIKELEVYQIVHRIADRIADLPVEAEDLPEMKRKVMVEAEMQLNLLPGLEPSSPVHSWILDAVNLGGKTCGDFQSKLIYASSRDGFTPDHFHAKCDGIPMTVCIIKDNRGNTHGCFSDVPWSSAVQRVPTANSFTFSLGDAVASHSKQSRSVVCHGPSHFISYDNDFTINSLFEFHLIQDGVRVTARNPARPLFIVLPLLVVDMAVYEISLKLRKSEHTSMTLDVAALNTKIIDSSDAAAEHIGKMARDIKEREEKLLMELLWIEHLSAPAEGRDIKAGRLSDWQAVKANAHALTADVSGMKTLSALEAVMARLHIIGSNEEGKCEAVDDEVVSYNVGGTIIAVLRSTLVRQAPNSAFASRFSGRWSEQANEDIEDGYICLVRYWY